MDANEKSALLPRPQKEEKDTHTVISVNDFIIRTVHILIFSCALVIGDITRAQYVYHWISRNTDLPESFFETNKSTGNISEQCATNSTPEAENEYQRLSAEWSLYFTLSEKIIILPVLMLFGIYSDFIGRKPLMIVSILVCVLKYGTITFFIFEDLHIKFFFISYVIAGLGGSSYTFFLANFAAVADTTSRSKSRSFNLALLDAMMGISAAASQISAGYLIGKTGYVYATMLSTGINMFLCLSVICLYKESRPKQHGKDSAESRISWNICKALRRITGFYTHTEQRRNMPLSMFLLLGLVFISVYAVNSSRSEIDTLYGLNFPFCWSPVKIGFYRGAKDIIQLGLGVLAVKILHIVTTDEVICIIGYLSGIATLTLTGFASSDWMIYCAAALGIMCIMPLPLLRGIFSKTILPDKQGALFANIFIIEVLCSLGGSAIFNNIYGETQAVMKGLVFLVMAGVFVFSLGLMILFLCLTSKQEYSSGYSKEVTVPKVSNGGNSCVHTDDVDLMHSQIPTFDNNPKENQMNVNTV